MIPCEWWKHPDAVAEALRWQACEAELLQLVVRPRGVNRGAGNPVEALLMTTAPLPLPVETMSAADLDPSPADLMLAAGGIAFGCSTDAATAYPELWATRAAAKSALQRKLGANPYGETSHTGMHLTSGGRPGLREVRYRREGCRCAPVSAWFDPGMVPDVRAVLTEKLGALAVCEVVDTRQPEPAPAAKIELAAVLHTESQMVARLDDAPAPPPLAPPPVTLPASGNVILLRAGMVASGTVSAELTFPTLPAHVIACTQTQARAPSLSARVRRT